jgi:NAD(P)-dependent dehydrogenase (short-subunit alcohol dehydrogenase family)
VIHNAGHMVFGPAEAFTPEQLAELYDVNVLSTQRVNRAALPQLRKQKKGLVIWVSSSSSAGGTPPYLAPYFAAKAGMDALAVIYARELTRWGIETSIIVPGAFTGGTNHFAHAGSPADKARAALNKSRNRGRSVSSTSVGGDARVLSRCAECAAPRWHPVISGPT